MARPADAQETGPASTIAAIFPKEDMEQADA